MDIIEAINSKNNVIHGKGVEECEIRNAESMLGLVFSNDYRKYVRLYGCMTIGNREFTGISKIANYDVIGITLTQKKYQSDIPGDWYVIEQMNIDGIVIWQDSSGSIYQSSLKTKTQKIANSLLEYILTS